MADKEEGTPRLHLKRLKEATNVAIKRAQRVKNTKLKGQAVNWGDLSCTSAEFRADDEGREYYAVVIEEADPGVAADGLGLYVREALRRKGYADVLVKTEW